MNTVFGSTKGAHILVHQHRGKHFAAYYIDDRGAWGNDAIGHGETAEEAARLLWHDLQRNTVFR